MTMPNSLPPSGQFESNAQSVVDCIRRWFAEDVIALHEPRFSQCDIDAVADVVKSSFVSSVGQQVIDFENALAEFTGVKHVIAVVNGTAALHAALLACGVHSDDEVITQSLTFVATCNAIEYCGAHPVFIDVDKDSMGLSPASLQSWLQSNTQKINGQCINKHTGRKVSACVPMHTFGMPARSDEITDICQAFGLVVIEDAAESLGSFYNGVHVGKAGLCATLSFNGNKIITTGGGGAVMTDDDELAQRLKHLTTTAKVTNGWASFHDEVGYNYRLPNLNAGLGVAQMEHLQGFLDDKKLLAEHYQHFFDSHPWVYVKPLPGALPNHWLNAILLPDANHRDVFIQYCVDRRVHVRPAWVPMHKLPAFSDCQRDDLASTTWLAERLVNLPSSARTLVT